MAAFQETRDHAEQKVMVQLLSEIEKNSSFTQRNLASDLGIALGLMNQYLKRCVSQGWVRVSQVSPRRIRYFLTPEGFREKSQMVTGYLARSLSFFRQARAQTEELFSHCQSCDWKRLGLVGDGDLADIFMLVSRGTGISVELTSLEKAGTYDVVAVVDTQNPQQIFNALRQIMPAERILTLELLHISRFMDTHEESEIDPRGDVK